MIDTIIFDLDGVLINSKDIHFEALNKSLSKNSVNYQINYEDHLKLFDGLTTKTKLEILNKKKILPKILNKKIKNEKNIITRKLLNERLVFNKKTYHLFEKLSKKFKIGIATNAIEQTLKIALKKLRISKFVNYSLSTENIKNPKPHPEVYLRCIINLNTKPKNTLVLEDSLHGRISAKEAGARLMPVKNLSEVTYKNIIGYIRNKKK